MNVRRASRREVESEGLRFCKPAPQQRRTLALALRRSALVHTQARVRGRGRAREHLDLRPISTRLIDLE